MKKIFYLLVIIVLLLFVSYIIKETFFSPLKVALVLTIDSENLPYNVSGLKGFNQAEKLFNIKTDYKVPLKIAEIRRYVLNYAEQGYDLIISLGFLGSEAVVEAAHKYPDIHFVLIDGQIESYLPNLTVVRFNHKGGSFLAGVLSAMVSNTNMVGFIGGMPSKLIQEFETGFTKGVYSYSQKNNKKIVPVIKYISEGPDGFLNPNEAYNIGSEMINAGVDVILTAAGISGSGIIDLAIKNKCFAIGIDVNQDEFAKGRILTSIVKHLDKAILEIIEKKVKNEKLNQNIAGGLKKNWITLTDFNFTRHIISSDMIDELNQFKNEAMELENK